MSEEVSQQPVGSEADDLVPMDDAIIGRAFRWSLGLFLVIGVMIAGMVFLLREPPKPAVVKTKTIVPPPPLVRDVDAVPELRFVDITKEAGIDFTHVNGAIGDKLLPETMGGGCAFLDYDGDGHADILLVNAQPWPEQITAGEPLPTLKLYRNDGSGRFSDVTDEAGLAVSLYGMGVAVGDYDNDGDIDLFVTAVGRSRLFRNDGGRFIDVTDRAGVGGDAQQWGTSAGFFDSDNDGLLDLFVCRYVKWSREIDFEVNYQLTGIGRAYGPPMNFEGVDCMLYRNNGDGTFRDVSTEAGITVKNPATGRPMGKALGVVFADVDRDGRLDVFVANDKVQRFFFRNNGDGTFRECGAECGLAFDRNGNATGAMGVDAAHYRNDDALAFVIGNFANEMSSLLVSQSRAMQFSDDAIVDGIGSPTRSALTFGAFFFDADLDGRLDLLHANGHIEDEINTVQPSQHYRQPGQLFWNSGLDASAMFVAVPEPSIGDLATPIVGRGAAYADIDGDGDLDVLLTQIAGPPLLLRNDQKAGQHWLRIRLVGGHGVNRDAIGAEITLSAGGAKQRRIISPTRSYLSQVELTATFGLGSADRVEHLEIRWPDGAVQVVEAAGVDHTIVVERAASAIH